MGSELKGLAILGSTGSVGTQTLDVVRQYPGSFRVVGLAAQSSLGTLGSQAREFHPALISCDGTQVEKAALFSNGSRESDLDEMVRHPDVDLVVTATIGDVALHPTIAAIEAGKDVALANKESIVIAGRLLTSLAKKYNVDLLPLDSEPNAIWQCLRGEDRTISRLIVTASGGAFRNLPPAELANVTPEQALEHPTWKMGPKITVDSATLMNKAFEVIEAHYLFGVPWEQIEVVIHPQSMIHSMVEFVDGSVKAQMSPPDMRLPIQYALFYPDRMSNDTVVRFDPVATGSLTFEELVPERYPCFSLALDVAKRGGTWPAALCGADDIAVEAFLDGRISFVEIPTVIGGALEGHQSVADPSLTESLAAAAWGRARVAALAGS